MIFHIIQLVQYLSGIPSIVTPGGDRGADMDTEHVEKDGSDVARGTKENPRR